MGQISLNIYADKENPQAITKTLTAEGYDLRMGTLEDFIQLFDLEKMEDPQALAKMILGAYNQLKDLLRDVFHGELTESDWRAVRFSDLLTVVTQIGGAVLAQLKILSRGNARRA